MQRELQAVVEEGREKGNNGERDPRRRPAQAGGREDGTEERDGDGGAAVAYEVEQGGDEAGVAAPVLYAEDAGRDVWLGVAGGGEGEGGEGRGGR